MRPPRMPRPRISRHRAREVDRMPQHSPFEHEHDPLPSSARSSLMARVRLRDTRPELAVRKVAHALGFRFRLHRRDLPGRPDLVFPRLRKVVFVHGCFWHRHSGCRRTTTPKVRAAFWQAKFAANIERDHRSIAGLEKEGWEVLVIWECETDDASKLSARLAQFLKSRTLESDTGPGPC
jgi:DNA mismatch endonuclease (patch repair protein)